MLGKSASPMATTLTHLPSHTTTASIASSAKGCSHSHAWEVVIAEDHLVIVVAVVLGEEAQLAEEVVGLQDQRLADLEREYALVRVGGDDAGGDVRSAINHLAAREHGDDFLEPLLAAQGLALVLGHVRYDGELLDAGREDHLTDVSGAALAFLFGGVGLGVHRGDGLLQEVEVAFGLIDGSAEELQSTHVSGSLDLDASLSSLLDDLLQLLGGVLGGLLVLLLGGLLILLLLRFLDVLLVHLDLLESVGLSLDLSDAGDLLDGLEESCLGLEGLGLPLLEGLLGKLSDDLEVLAATADDSLDAGGTLEGADVGQNVLEGTLGLHQGGVVVIGGPLESPLAGDVLELDEGHVDKKGR
mmetsp:Transcript_3705/g.5067  ORF Transcript_3705/g.5067 Transcript_3705/m.5067 type:complete len:357 (+) Transcript_3705:182-1252(+)